MSIRKVAEHTGVSVWTVSRVINNRDGVSDATRERILAAVRELGYQSDDEKRRGAQKLRLAGKKAPLENVGLCFINDGYSKSYDSVILRAALSECEARNLRLRVCQYGKDLPVPKEFETGLLDAAIITGAVDDAALARLSAYQIPLIVLGNYDLESKVSRVTIDGEVFGENALRILAEHGHRRVAFISEAPQIVWNRELLEGFRMEAAKQNICLAEEHIHFTAEIGESVAGGVLEIMNSGQPPTALFITTKRLATSVITSLGCFGFKVPHDISLLCSGFAIEFPCIPRLTAMHADTSATIASAVNHLSELYRDPSLAGSMIGIKTFDFVSGDSLSDIA